MVELVDRQICFRLADAVPAASPPGQFRLGDAAAEALSELLQVFACGEESAAHAFAHLGSSPVEDAARRGLVRVADEELIRCGPRPHPLSSPSRLIAWYRGPITSGVKGGFREKVSLRPGHLRTTRQPDAYVSTGKRRHAARCCPALHLAKLLSLSARGCLAR